MSKRAMIRGTKPDAMDTSWTPSAFHRTNVSRNWLARRMLMRAGTTVSTVTTGSMASS